MASFITDIKFYNYLELEFVITFKVMKSIRYNVDTSSTSGNVIKISMPHYYTFKQACEFIDKNYDSFLAMRNRFLNSKKKIVQTPTPEQLDLWFKLLDEMIPELTAMMGIDFKLKFSSSLMRSRWGSCSPRRRAISLNAFLASLPEECTRYVLVHEFAHLTYPNHSPAFWQIVELYFPDYRRVRRDMRNLCL